MAKKQNNNEASQEISVVREVVSMLLYIAFIIIAVWFILTFVGQRTQVSGSSMYDTLEDGDNLWIDKLSYHLTLWCSRIRTAMYIISNVL